MENIDSYIFFDSFVKTGIKDNQEANEIILQRDYILDIFLSDHQNQVYYNFYKKILIINIVGLDNEASNFCKQVRIKYNYLQTYIITYNNLIDCLNVTIIHPTYHSKLIEYYENLNKKVFLPKKSWFSYLYSFIN